MQYFQAMPICYVYAEVYDGGIYIYIYISIYIYTYIYVYIACMYCFVVNPTIYHLLRVGENCKVDTDCVAKTRKSILE